MFRIFPQMTVLLRLVSVKIPVVFLPFQSSEVFVFLSTLETRPWRSEMLTWWWPDEREDLPDNETLVQINLWRILLFLVTNKDGFLLKIHSMKCYRCYRIFIGKSIKKTQRNKTYSYSQSTSCNWKNKESKSTIILR